ncbi:uncharacterized protein ATNIH1004_000830 [Aspergillus tanneri]|uniref:DUF4211 domain-containing protein n=1 Tax=Aspergillus tanneri TaxID=1220188 RepID=A0A5M9MXU5_9EURO|nr:uncharacterized protein ATNIH1004_000830 [Aspergillus tanneri]KAA8651931.1 hypothetical protein ATNIH1004_000830 [Aspergillus tanneri]
MPRTYGKAKQTRLSFAPIALPSDDNDLELDEEMRHQATLRYGHPSKPTRTTQPKSGRAADRETSLKPFVVTKSALEENTLSAELKDTSRKSRRKKEEKKDKDRKRKKEENTGKKKSTSPPPPTPETLNQEIAAVADESSESEMDIQSSVRKNATRRALKRKRSPNPDESNHPSPEISAPAASEESDEEDVISRPRRKLRRGTAPPKTIVLDDSSEESESPIPSSPVKRLRHKTSPVIPQTPRRNLDQDELDLQEDLQDLQDSVVRETRTRGRLANSARAQRQIHLDRLRRRRAKEKQDEDDDVQSGSESAQLESAEESSDEADSDGESAIKQPRFHLMREESDVESSIASDEDLDRYEKDFVLEDENDRLGVPVGMEDMPIEFSRHSYKQLKDYFQDAVEWMVFNQLNPSFPRSSPIYRVAFEKLEVEVQGRTGSQLLSSVWNTNFRRALLARPYVEETAYPTAENHPCDACNRSGHPASFDIKIYGKPYSFETLEPLANEDSDEEQSAEDDLERDRDGHILPDEDIRYYLGRHCKNKATMAHTLTHWRFHLNEWVVDHLQRMGYLSDENILERSHWRQRRKEKYAAEAVGTMIETGEVKKLWHDFHVTLRTARESTTLG